MKVVVEFEFVNKESLKEAIENCERLEEQHIVQRKCKNPDKCGELRQLWWMKETFKNVLAQLEHIEETNVFRFDSNFN